MEHEELFPLLCAVAQGDQSAFSKLYDATSGQLYAVALRMLGDKALAEEATQDAYVKIWHNAGNYQTGKGTVLTWMVSIVRYRALDIIRYYKIRKETPLEDEPDFSISDTQTLDFKAEQKLDICMEQLEGGQKQAICLAYFGGLSHQEVELHMNTPLGTIKSWIRRGLQSLQRCLGI